MFEDEYRKKREKAKNYAQQPERFKVEKMKLKMDSLNGEREITFENGKWHCTCEFYKKAQANASLDTCSHIMAVKEITKFKEQE